jgi:hypothetical protein
MAKGPGLADHGEVTVTGGCRVRMQRFTIPPGCQMCTGPSIPGIGITWRPLLLEGLVEATTFGE